MTQGSIPVQTTLVHGFLETLARYPQALALYVDDTFFSYSDLFRNAALLSCLIEQEQSESKYVAILSKRKVFAFESILASLFSGKAFVPFDLNIDEQKLQSLLVALDCHVLVVDEFFYARFSHVLEQLPPALIVYSDVISPAAESKHTFFDADTLKGLLPEQASKIEKMLEQGELSVEDLCALNKAPALQASMLAYVLFTSGSTGAPKAVPITHSNICHYISEITALYPVYAEDRCTQGFEFGFDPSVHDMFVTWFNGASLYVMDERKRLGAHYFIRKHQISIWNSIPSLVKLCLSVRSFNESYLSSVRRVFFNGEALHASVAQALQEKIPSAELINLYGLTETTVNLCHYRWQGEASLPACDSGVVPIGKLFTNIKMLEPEVQLLPFELLLSGAQVFDAYLEIDQDSASKNDNTFVELKGKRFFKTGDLVYQDNNACLHIQGRNDEQIKVHGKWVDLNSLREQLEKVSTCLDALVLSYKNTEEDIKLVGFLQGEGFDDALILTHVNKVFESHMHLEKIIVLEHYPYLPSGKVDKQSLKAML